MIDENLLFIILITILSIFIINKQPKLIITLLLIGVVYYVYNIYFINPKDFFTFIKHKLKEGFQPCSINNSGYCGNDGNASNTTFLPDIMRSGIPSNAVNNNNNIQLKFENYTIDKRLKLGKEEITIDTMIREVPLLLNYKLYLETIIKFIINININNTDNDNIQKNFLATKISYNMTKIFYNAYNTVTNTKYPINIYNDLLFSQREFNDTLNIINLLELNNDNNKIPEFQKEFKNMNSKLNKYIVEKVNNLTPKEYNITTSFLPRQDEPMGINLLNNDEYSNYMDI